MLLLCAPMLMFAQGINKLPLMLTGTLWESIEGAMDWINGLVFFSVNFPIIGERPFVLIWLVIGALFFTFYNGFVNLYVVSDCECIRHDHWANHNQWTVVWQTTNSAS